jgi:hypothetical protein
VPIVLVIVIFQLLVLRRPFPQVFNVVVGLFMVVLGLALFVLGLEIGLFPIGETMAEAFALKGSLFWLLLFGFGLGFSTTVAEPALIAITEEAAEVAAGGGVIAADEATMADYALGLRLTVAVSVGVAIIGGYIGVVIMTAFAPPEIVGIAYDSGGVTTSTVTVPLVTALGVGLASAIRGRNPLIDGFGLIAFASLLPLIFVMAYGMMMFN